MHLQSRNGRPLTRYFPELAFPDTRVVLDGEIVIHGPDGRQLFNALGQRIHPAASRIQMLSEQTPAHFIAFDLLAHGDDVLLELPYDERRAALEAFVGGLEDPPFELTPVVHDPADAEGWLPRRRGRHRQGARRALQARRAHGHGEDQAGADDRRGRPRLAARARRSGRSARSSSACTTRTASSTASATRAGSARRRSASSSTSRARRDRRARLGGSVSVGERPRARVDRAAPRARR